MRFKGKIDFEKAIKGHPSVYLPIIHFSLLVFSPPVAEYITNKGFDMFAKTDYSFMGSVFEILAMLFKYKAPFTLDQFFSHE
mmetsp:Transcript_43424/g.41876  ORF Transcript_43424/g.41876 Transcript_43424/m.41876 type:complete len:82 (-) Transcript_43424:1537-1782(-)